MQIERINECLRADKHTELIIEEAVGGRLYTGPMYEKVRAFADDRWQWQGRFARSPRFLSTRRLRTLSCTLPAAQSNTALRIFSDKASNFHSLPMTFH